MKRTIHIGYVCISITILLTIINTSCHTSTLFDASMNIQQFQFDLHPSVTKNKIVQITPEDIQNYFLSNEDRTTWILFFYQDCMKTVSKAVNLYHKFSDQLDLVIISSRYNVEEIKYEEFYMNYPIYFIPVITDRMRANKRIFMKQLFGKHISKESATASNIFVYKNRIVHTCYSHDINENLLKFITDNTSTESGLKR